MNNLVLTLLPEFWCLVDCFSLPFVFCLGIILGGMICLPLLWCFLVRWLFRWSPLGWLLTTLQLTRLEMSIHLMLPLVIDMDWTLAGSFWACSCSRPNLSNWNTPDPLWNTTHKVTWGCSPMECKYFGLEGNCKSWCSGVYHLSSPCHCHHWSAAWDGHHHQLPCWML